MFFLKYRNKFVIKNANTIIDFQFTNMKISIFLQKQTSTKNTIRRVSENLMKLEIYKGVVEGIEQRRPGNSAASVLASTLNSNPGLFSRGEPGFQSLELRGSLSWSWDQEVRAQYDKLSV